MAILDLQISRDASRALEEFSDEFRGALALADFESWAANNGLVRTSSALRTTFPIPLDEAGYKELKGDIKYRSLYSRSMSMVTKEWSDGVEAVARVIEAPDFIDWSGAPARMAAEWLRLENEMVATMLESGSGNDGPVLDFYTDKDTNTVGTRQLFASDHPYNVIDSAVGTFDNDADTTVAQINSGEFFDTTENYFRGLKGPNGKPLGIRLEGGMIIVPPARSQLFKKVLEGDTLIRAISNAGVVDATSSVVAGVTTNNLYKGTIGRTVADELTQTDVFYVLAGGKPGLYPWVIQKEGAPEERLFDKSSEYYKDTGKVKVGYVGVANAAACLPHRILKVTITG